MAGAFAIKDSLDRLKTYVDGVGDFSEAFIGEPKAPPMGDKPSVAIFMNSARVVQLMLDGATVEVHVVTMRIYRNMLQDGVDNAETDLAEAVSNISKDILGEYDLGATVRNVDAAGAHGTGWGLTWGYVDISGTMFRIVDIQVPMVVDGSVTMAA